MENINANNLWISRTNKIALWSALIAGFIMPLGIVIQKDIVGIVIPLVILFAFAIYLIIIRLFIFSNISPGNNERLKFFLLNILKWLAIFIGASLFFMVVSELAKVTGWV